MDVPLANIRRFQIFAALVLDTIWFARNKLIHNNIQPVPAKTVQQLRITHEYHISAWQVSALSSLWSPPQPCVKGNFDVAICGNFAVTAAVISDSSEEIICAATEKLFSSYALSRKASTALLGFRLATSSGFNNLMLEEDALLVILAMNKLHIFAIWQFAPIVLDLRLELSSFQSWNALKVSRHANFCAHVLAKWAATHLVFDSIPLRSPILSSIRIKNEKYPPL